MYYDSDSQFICYSLVLSILTDHENESTCRHHCLQGMSRNGGIKVVYFGCKRCWGKSLPAWPPPMIEVTVKWHHKSQPSSCLLFESLISNATTPRIPGCTCSCHTVDWFGPQTEFLHGIKSPTVICVWYDSVSNYCHTVHARQVSLAWGPLLIGLKWISPLWTDHRY